MLESKWIPLISNHPPIVFAPVSHSLLYLHPLKENCLVLWWTIRNALIVRDFSNLKYHLLSVLSPPTLQSLLWCCRFLLVGLWSPQICHPTPPSISRCNLLLFVVMCRAEKSFYSKDWGVSGLFNTPHCCGFDSSFRASRSDILFLVPLSSAAMLQELFLHLFKPA